MPDRHFLALDFDGVIADSILECLVTAQNAFAAYNHSDEFRIDVSQFDDADIQQFRAARVFIRRGEDYVFLRLASQLGFSIRTQFEFDKFLKKHESKREKFRDLFYGMRSRLQTSHLDEWIALSPLYPDVEIFLKILKGRDSIYIVTTKDLKSVELILESRGIKLISKNMVQATKTLRKPAILKKILKVESLDAHQLHFVDDHPATVLEVSEHTDVMTYCASWGYNTSNQRSILKDPKIQVLDLDNFRGLVRSLGMNE